MDEARRVRLRYTRTALIQIDRVLAYLAPHSPRAASDLRERILATADLLRHHPLAGQATSRAGVRRAVLSPYPYILFYRVSGDEVIVTRLRHAARKPDAPGA